MIDLILPAENTLTEDLLDKGVILGYKNNKLHGLLVKVFDDDFRYSYDSNCESFCITEDSFKGLLESIIERYPGISFKLLT